MKKPVSIPSPGRLTVLAALLAGLCGPAIGADTGTRVVISQVYGGGGNSGATYTNDFIELFNRSAEAVPIGDWSVQYASAAGGGTSASTWGVTAIPAGTTLQPGQYYLIQEAQGAGGSTALPFDLNGIQGGGKGLALSGSAGKVALVSSTTPLASATPGGASLVDLVGFGAAATGFEGSGPTAAPSNTTAVLRKVAGCTDDNSNDTDFSVGAPTPRNSATVKACGSVTPPAYPIVASCPAFSVVGGSGGFGALSAADQDNRVTGAAIGSGAVAGITLGVLTPSSANGASASVNLNVAASVPAAVYPMVINFSNDGNQSGSCSCNLTVSGDAAVTFSIPEIQGAGATSPHLGVQTTEGVVTAKVGTGFFIQDERANGDGDPATSDAIFVYTGSTPAAVALGDLVRVTANVTEFTPNGGTRSITEMTAVSAVKVLASGRSITPANIELVGTDLARYEGMLVRFVAPLTVSQSEFLGSRGELTLSSGRLEVPTNKYRPRTAEAIAMAAANAANMIVLDDGISVAPKVVPYIGADGTIRAGDSVAGLTGVIDYAPIGGGGAAFKLQPTVAPVFARDNPRPAAPSFAQGNVKVASANVLNFFTTFTDGSDVSGATGQGCTPIDPKKPITDNCRGADSLAEFIRQRDKIVNALKLIDADVFGLMEIQNKGEYTVTYLTDALNAAIGGAPTYAVVPAPATSGGDAIRVAMIYKPSKLTMVGTTMSDASAVFQRAPMAATFKAANGGKFSLIVNHLKSKGSCPGGTGVESDLDGQGCWNAMRTRQATQLRDGFIPAVVSAAGDPDVLVIGDLNAHGFEDPINLLTDAGMVNQLERYVRAGGGTPYSFIFDGQSGYLDHALASPSMSPQVSGASEFHNNADEPKVIDYNLDGKPQDLYVNDAYRASDHDPVIITLDLAPSFVNVTASFTVVRSGIVLNRATGQYSGTYSFTNKTAAAINGPFQVEFAGLPAGVTLAGASLHNGVPYLSSGAASIAPGATVTLTTSFINPGKVGIGYTATIYSGTF